MRLQGLFGMRGVGYDLDNAGPVTQVDKHDAAVLTNSIDPTVENDPLTICSGATAPHAIVRCAKLKICLPANFWGHNVRSPTPGLKSGL